MEAPAGMEQPFQRTCPHCKSPNDNDHDDNESTGDRTAPNQTNQANQGKKPNHFKPCSPPSLFVRQYTPPSSPFPIGVRFVDF
jgi:hypothetical protein